MWTPGKLRQLGSLNLLTLMLASCNTGGAASGGGGGGGVEFDCQVRCSTAEGLVLGGTISFQSASSEQEAILACEADATEEACPAGGTPDGCTCTASAAQP